MWHVYVLYSPLRGKTYTGFSNDIQRRLNEHNSSKSKGFTLRYRPWILIHTESFDIKIEAMTREKFLKTGKGRGEVKLFVKDYLLRYPPQAEKD